MANIVKYPIYQTFENLGMSREEIEYDAVDTIIERVRGMSNREREDLGLTDDWMNQNNLYTYIHNGRIKLHMMKDQKNLHQNIIYMQI